MLSGQGAVVEDDAKIDPDSAGGEPAACGGAYPPGRHVPIEPDGVASSVGPRPRGPRALDRTPPNDIPEAGQEELSQCGRIGG